MLQQNCVRATIFLFVLAGAQEDAHLYVLKVSKHHFTMTFDLITLCNVIGIFMIVL